jgi:histidine ammonia-lyase
MTAARALDLRAPLEPAAGTGAAVAAVRAVVAGPGADRYLAPEVEAVVQLVQSGGLLSAVQEVVGELE